MICIRCNFDTPFREYCMSCHNYLTNEERIERDLCQSFQDTFPSISRDDLSRAIREYVHSFYGYVHPLMTEERYYVPKYKYLTETEHTQQRAYMAKILEKYFDLPHTYKEKEHE